MTRVVGRPKWSGGSHFLGHPGKHEKKGPISTSKNTPKNATYHSRAFLTLFAKTGRRGKKNIFGPLQKSGSAPFFPGFPRFSPDFPGFWTIFTDFPGFWDIFCPISWIFGFSGISNFSNFPEFSYFFTFLGCRVQMGLIEHKIKLTFSIFNFLTFSIFLNFRNFNIFYLF